MSSFLLDNKSFTVDVAADGNTADLIQTNTVPFTAEQLDNAKSKNYYKRANKKSEYCRWKSNIYRHYYKR